MKHPIDPRIFLSMPDQIFGPKYSRDRAHFSDAQSYDFVLFSVDSLDFFWGEYRACSGRRSTILKIASNPRPSTNRWTEPQALRSVVGWVAEDRLTGFVEADDFRSREELHPIFHEEASLLKLLPALIGCCGL